MEGQQAQRTRRKFSDEFKRDAVEIVRSSDKSIAEVARELGIYDSSLGNWVKQDEDVLNTRITAHNLGLLSRQSGPSAGDSRNALVLDLGPMNVDNKQRDTADALGAFSRGYKVFFGVLGGLFVTAVLAVTVLVGYPRLQDPATLSSSGGLGDQGELSAQASVGLETFRDVGCAACHGENGEGGVGPALPGHTEEQVFRQVRAPIGDVMPSFPVTVLSDEDVRNIYAWIATLGDEMVMAHEEEEEGGHDELVISSTEISHLRLLLTSVEANNTDDAIRHIEHIARHGAEPELLGLAAAIEADLRAGRLHDAEGKALEALGPAADEEFDAIAAHLGMAIVANDRGEGQDVEFHISAAVEASVGHDHEVILRNLLEDWRNGDDRHVVIDALYGALKLDHPLH